MEQKQNNKIYKIVIILDNILYDSQQIKDVNYLFKKSKKYNIHVIMSNSYALKFDKNYIDYVFAFYESYHENIKRLNYYYDTIIGVDDLINIMTNSITNFEDHKSIVYSKKDNGLYEYKAKI